MKIFLTAGGLVCFAVGFLVAIILMSGASNKPSFENLVAGMFSLTLMGVGAAQIGLAHVLHKLSR